MIKISLVAQRRKPLNTFVNFYSRTIKLSEYKYFEFERVYCGQSLFRFSLDLSWTGKDHAGPEFELGVWGHEIRIKLYDNRHWNYEKGRWYVGSEEWNLLVEEERKMFKTHEDKYYK